MSNRGEDRGNGFIIVAALALCLFAIYEFVKICVRYLVYDDRDAKSWTIFVFAIAVLAIVVIGRR